MAIPWQDHLLDDDYLDLSNYVEDDERIMAKTNLMKPIGPSIWVVVNNNNNNNSDNIKGGGDHQSDGSTNASRTDTATITSQPAKESSSSSSNMFSSVWNTLSTAPLTNLVTSSWKSNATSQYNTVIIGLRGGGGAFVWNPTTPLTTALKKEIQARCGGVRHIVVPNKYHLGSKYLRQWSKAYTLAKLYAPSDYTVEDDEYFKVANNTGKRTNNDNYNNDTMEKDNQNGEDNDDDDDDDDFEINFDFILTTDTKRDFVLDIDQVIFKGSKTDEVVFYHRMSNTVLFCDLLQEHIPKNNNNQESSKAASTAATIAANTFASTIATSWFMASTTPTGTDSEETTTTTATTNATSDNDVESPSKAVPKAAYNYCTPYTWQLSFWWQDEQELARKALDVIMKKWNPSQMVLSCGDQSIVTEHVPDIIEHVFEWVPGEQEFASSSEPTIDKETLGGFQRGTFSTGSDFIVVENEDVPPSVSSPTTNNIESAVGAAVGDTGDSPAADSIVPEVTR